MRDVEEFASDKDLTDIVGYLKKGALIAQDPARFEEIQMLEEEEKQYLRHEKAHKWKHPLQLYITIIVCSIGAAVQYVITAATARRLLIKTIEVGTRQG